MVGGGRESRVADLLICSLIDHRALLGAFPLHIPPVFITQTCTGLVSERVPVPTMYLAALYYWYWSVPVPIVLVMMQTGPPTSRHIIPCWYAMHVTTASASLVFAYRCTD